MIRQTGAGERAEGCKNIVQVCGEIARRDRQDRGRKLAPLVVPKGAIVIDSTGKSVAQVVKLMLTEVRRIQCSTRS